MNFIEAIYNQIRGSKTRILLTEVHGKKLESLTSESIFERVQRARKHLRDLGVKRGDRVLLYGPNSYLWVIYDLAILFEGAICVPFYSRQNPKELAYMAEHAEPACLIFASNDLYKTLAEHWSPNCPVSSMDEGLKKEPLSDPPIDVDSADTVTMFYTSGTSGRPKGVMLNRSSVDFMLQSTLRQLTDTTQRATPEDHVFHFLPFCFAGSRIMLWTQLFRGNPLMISTDLQNLKEELSTANPQYYLNVPALLERVRQGVSQKIQEKGGFAQWLFNQGQIAWNKIYLGRASAMDRFIYSMAKVLIFRKIKNLIGSRLEFLICGSAALSEETQKWFFMLGIPVLQVYGLTETTAIVTMDSLSKVKPGYVGCPIDGVEVQISSEGELLVRGPNIFQGYWKNKEETDASFAHGWFKTGDQVEIDQDGRVRIVGRMKNLLIPESGHNIAPEPLEETLKELCPGAEHVVVVGHGRPHLVALVTGSVSPGSIQHALEQFNSNVPHYRKIKSIQRLDDTFTPENGFLTANQKLKRNVIEQHYRNLIDSLYREGAIQ